MLLIVSMGIPKKDIKEMSEGFRFEKAIIQIIDWGKKKVIKEIQYRPPNDHFGQGLSIQFKGAYLHGDYYYVVTNTEVLCYSLSSWHLEDVISLPCFNDLHGVMRTGELLYIVNTGLEVIQVFDLNKRAIVREINMATRPTYERFNPESDYRLIATTKPHEAHVNHIFEMGGQIWATRGQKRDAVNIDDMSIRLRLPHKNSEKVVLCHDGIMRAGKLYFTGVDAHILTFDPANKELQDDLDLSAINTTKYSLGWTRGLEIVNGQAFLGLSKMRPTTFKDYTSWFVRGEKKAMPSAIINIDMANRMVMDYYIMEHYTGHAIFTILLHPNSA